MLASYVLSARLRWELQLNSMTEPLRLVASGVEAATHLRRLPCEVHRDIVLRTLDKDPVLDLKKLLQAIGADRDKLGASFADGWATQYPTVFPLLNALATGASDGQSDAIKRPTSAWGARALLEAGMMRYFKNGASKL